MRIYVTPGRQRNLYMYSSNVKPHRANLLLQIMLQSNVYTSILWTVSYLGYLLLNLHDLWNYEGLATFLAFVLAGCSEAARLYAGYTVNLCDGIASMWLLLTLTPFVLLPSLLYLRLVSRTQTLFLQYMSDVLFVLIGLEALVVLLRYACLRSKKRQESLKNPVFPSTPSPNRVPHRAAHPRPTRPLRTNKSW
ncbi:uncharacterized protein LOC115627663 [Scaptodrosophila lebanonensis]|uniref:Uncharacterized protein LOC115627663 n=1 Tax=Drosophila lebanonensis TaxID=7225 RepID=A0A6J2TUK1_DROLE|nr:uncharacterized protein LOC115627663 [Scaptodrosophila lebanonensis]